MTPSELTRPETLLDHTVRVMNFSSRAGDFALFNGLNLLGTGCRLQPVYSPNGLTLVTTNLFANAPGLRLTREDSFMLVGWPTEFGGYRLLSATNIITMPFTNMNNEVVERLVQTNWAEFPLTGTNKSLFAPTNSQRYFLSVSP